VEEGDVTVPAQERRGKRRRERPSEPAKEPAKSAPRTRSSRRDFARENARLIAAVALFVCGIVLVLLGWYGAANTNILSEQIPYLISGGLLGLGLIMVAGFFASSVGLERENRELRRQMERAVAGMAAGGAPRLSVVSSNPSPRTSDGVFTVPGGHSYHQAGCPLVEGKNATEVSIPEATGSGLVPCKLCGPE
jgi:hypothetical protein